jgi:hypothetical protein
MQTRRDSVLNPFIFPPKEVLGKMSLAARLLNAFTFYFLPYRVNMPGEGKMLPRSIHMFC